MQTTALNVPNARRARLCAAAHTVRAARVAATAAQRCRQQGRPVRCPAAAGRPAIRRWRRGSGGSGTAEPTTARIGNRLPGRQACKSELARRCDSRRKRAANLCRATSGNFGRKAGPRKAWREGVFDGQEVSAPHAAWPQSGDQGADRLGGFHRGQDDGRAGYSVHARQILHRTRQLLEGAADVFGAGRRVLPPVDLVPLHPNIGQLALEHVS